METKLFEIRDRATFMPAMATRARSSNEQEIFLLGEAGFIPNTELVILHFLASDMGSWNRYSWRDRTRAIAHDFIIKNWDDLKTGDVIDVEYISGESKTKKTSERSCGKWLK
jgi:hypothetical protein